MVLVTGGSGSGKSSLVNALNGFIPHIRPTRIGGDVKVDGLEPAEVELAEAGRVAATVFQNPRTQFFATDVLSEIAFGASNQGVPREEILRRIDAAVDLLDLAHLLDRRMGELSGGERQRVALASAVVSRPRLFLLDEPTANLDDASTQAVAEALAHLKGAGATILVAEHRLHYLRGLVDRVVQLHRGRVVADCPAAEFWEMGEGERRDAGLRSLVAPASDPLPAPPPPRRMRAAWSCALCRRCAMAGGCGRSTRRLPHAVRSPASPVRMAWESRRSCRCWWDCAAPRGPWFWTGRRCRAANGAAAVRL